MRWNEQIQNIQLWMGLELLFYSIKLTFSEKFQLFNSFYGGILSDNSVPIWYRNFPKPLLFLLWQQLEKEILAFPLFLQIVWCPTKASKLLAYSSILDNKLSKMLLLSLSLLSFRMATLSAEKSGLSRGSSDQHLVIILMISSSAQSSFTIGLKRLLPAWLGRRTPSTMSWKTTLDFLEQGALKHSAPDPAPCPLLGDSDLKLRAMKLRQCGQSMVQTFFVGVREEENILPIVGDRGNLVLWIAPALLELKSPGFDGGLWIKKVGDLGGVAPVLLECRRTYLPQNDMSIPVTGASKRSLFSMSMHFEELQFIS